MAWSYNADMARRGWTEGDYLDIVWFNQWTVQEVSGGPAGSIRLNLNVSTSAQDLGTPGLPGFWVWSKYGVYDCYCTDSITCGSTTLNFLDRRIINNAYNYSATLDVPNSWAGQTVMLDIAWRTVNVTLGASPSYTLSTSAGTGCSISVNRSTSNVGATGSIGNGAIIYSGDILDVSFVPSTDYGIVTHTVNGAAFTSGRTHTVSGNVSIAATAQPLASEVAATDANIGAVSTIQVTKHSTGYYHSLQYSFGNLSGYITRTGAVSATESKMNDTSVSFTVPADFYAQIPSSKTGTCTITCRTYSSATSTSVLGTAKTCTFTVTASSASSSPTVSGTVVDINETTKALTGDENVLIKYKSKARATITASAKNSASIASMTVNNLSITTTRDFTNTEAASYVFVATDSRDYSATATVTKSIVNYVPLTINATLVRPGPTSNHVLLSFYGNYFRGSFGAASNTLTVQYRYHGPDTSSFSGWVTVDSSKYTIASNNSYTSGSVAVDLGDSFDYQKAYTFQVRAIDGTASVTLSTAVVEYIVQKGTPVFDWGENDFKFNVPVDLPGLTINGVSLATYIMNIVNGS